MTLFSHTGLCNTSLVKCFWRSFAILCCVCCLWSAAIYK